MAGAPRLDVDYEQLLQLLQSRVKKSEIAQLFGVSRPTLDRIITDYQLEDLARWSQISDTQLDNLVKEALEILPFIGERMISGFLSAKQVKVQRRRIRQSIHRVDPGGVALRRERLNTRIRRRVYSVPHAHYMWHLDGNHKLIRWKLVVHAAIDGYSRACVYLRCSDNNKSETVLECFKEAIQSFNVIPTRIRTDHGGENMLVWKAMLEANPDTRHPVVLVGASVHNQRIERFNRDINIHIRQYYGAIFYQLESTGLLDIGNNLDIFTLHYVFLPRINQTLDILRQCHNNHKIRTEGNMTPIQLLATSQTLPIDTSAYTLPQSETASHQSVHDLIRMGNAPIPPTDRLVTPLSPSQMDHLLESVPPTTDDSDYGITVYKAVREYVHQCGNHE